jgi:hypothetical protein
MKKRLLMVLMVLGIASFAHLTPAFAQAAAPAAPAATEEDKFSFGKVVSIADGQITVKEYDFTKDIDVEAVYSIVKETELGNINAVTDLKAGDDVVIDYIEKDGKRQVSTLVKEEKGAENVPGEGDMAAPVAAPEAPAVPAADAVQK